MDILDNNKTLLEKDKSAKIIKIIILMLVILFITTIAIGIIIINLKLKEFKVSIDGSKVNLDNDIIIIQDGKCYVSIKDIAKYLEYTAYNGEYKQYSEDITKCYLQGNNEVVSYELNSKTLYKLITLDDNKASSRDIDTNNYEYYTIEEPVKMINNKLYTTIEGISIGTNIDMSYDAEKNSVQIFTLPYLVKYYTNLIQDSAVADEDAIFSNKKALLYGMIVVKDQNKKYGVFSLDNSEIIGKKYSSIKFLENSQEFIVGTEEGKMGIVAKDASTKIKPEYDEIKQIDKDTGLYLVSNNKKYGVVNKNGKIIIYLEYDNIGIDVTNFTSDNIKNEYLIYDNCIPVKKGKLWGIIDKNGNEILPVEYDGLGCIIGNSSDKNANNLLLIPEYGGIVVCKNKTYGIINSSGKELIPVAVTDMYSITSSGVNKYYLTYQQNTMDIEKYFEDNNIQPINKKIENSNNTNTVIDGNSIFNNKTVDNDINNTGIIEEPIEDFDDEFDDDF